MKQIFLVEDDENIRELVEYSLQNSGYVVKSFENAEKFFQELNVNKPDLAILDIMLPKMNGVEIVEKLNEEKLSENMSIIMLTAKNSEVDKLKSFDLGVDDYVTKPFSVLELIARVKAILRRNKQKNVSDYLYFSSIVVDALKRKVSIEKKEIDLTYKEFELLKYLIKNSDFVLSRDDILNKVWGYNYEGESRTVDVHIKALRKKLGKCGENIKTVRGVGYKITTEK